MRYMICYHRVAIMPRHGSPRSRRFSPSWAGWIHAPRAIRDDRRRAQLSMVIVRARHQCGAPPREPATPSIPTEE